jgi:hypothetical protein
LILQDAFADHLDIAYAPEVDDVAEEELLPLLRDAEYENKRSQLPPEPMAPSSASGHAASHAAAVEPQQVHITPDDWVILLLRVIVVASCHTRDDIPSRSRRLIEHSADYTLWDPDIR